jgi:hypothetical protein
VTKLVAAIVILTIGYVASLYVRSSIWENEVGERASFLLADIAKPWSAKNILSHASIALQASPYENIEMREEAASHLLGNLEKITKMPECNIWKGIDTYSHKEYSYASCGMRVEFEKRASDITIKLVNQKNQWRIDDFQVHLEQ